jgi:hypothetical protein
LATRSKPEVKSSARPNPAQTKDDRDNQREAKAHRRCDAIPVNIQNYERATEGGESESSGSGDQAQEQPKKRHFPLPFA